MARKKIKTQVKKRSSAKVVKKRRLKNKSAFPKVSFKLVFLTLLILIFGIILILKISNFTKVEHPKFVKNLSVKPHVQAPKPLITPYLTITPKATATPVPLSGYCLFVPILTYHHVQPEADAKTKGETSLTVDNVIFDQQMAYLRSHGYTPIWANELINALITHSELPGKPVMITMDDGYADNANFALSVLQKYGIKANLMLASGLVGANSDMLTWDQVNQLKSSGLIYFTNHTWSHYPIVGGAQSKIDTEIDIAQTEIQQHTGQTVNVFTYPYGSFNNNAIATLQRKGYIGAYSTIPGQYQCDSFIMSLHRTRIGNAPLSSYGL
jgi:peptidoglycan/xylan/chitin deacetylase (PgdA/CDA1 family)